MHCSPFLSPEVVDGSNRYDRFVKMSAQNNLTDDAVSRGALREMLELSQGLRLEVFSIGKGPMIALVIAAWFLLSAYTRPVREIAGAPVSGRRAWWEPDISLFWRYTANAREIIDAGAQKV